MKVGILGFGKMGEAIALGLFRSEHADRYEVSGTTQSEKSAKSLSERMSFEVHCDNRKLVKSVDVILFCVKPHHAEKVAKQIAPVLKKGQLLISICASVTTEQLSKWLGGKGVIIRAMPNTPCLIQQGMTVLCGGPRSKDSDLVLAQEIFNTLGQSVIIPENLMDGATGLSGCGPAYVYLMIESLSEAGVKVGLSREVATLLAAQTLSGAAQMVLKRGVHPAALKDEVTTPAGCTVDGLMALEEGKLRVTLIKAVVAASQRSEKLRGPKRSE